MADKKKFSAWAKIQSNQQRLYPSEQAFQEAQARWNPYGSPESYQAPVDPNVLTGDMAASSPRQQAAQAQFDANMRGGARPVEPETPMEMEDRLQREMQLRQMKQNPNRVGG